VSKAFTKEDDGSDESLPPYVPPWPPGTHNYVTPGGFAALRSEQAELAVAAPSREVRRRMAVVAAHLEAAEVITPPHGPVARVQFGTAVTVRDEGGSVKTWSIVGVDEVSAAERRVSWLSPIARAMQGAQVGDAVTVRTPRGEEVWEIESIVGLGGA